LPNSCRTSSTLKGLMAGAQQGRAYDWPLSREEKKSRVLELYETEAQVTSQFLLCCDGAEDVDSLRHSASIDAAVSMGSFSPERQHSPPPKDTFRTKDCSTPHTGATNMESQPLDSRRQDFVQRRSHGRSRRNTDCAAGSAGSVGSPHVNSHAMVRRRRRHSAAVESKGKQPLLLEGTTAKHGTACPLPKPSRSGKPAKHERQHGQHPEPALPSHTQKGKAPLGSQGVSAHSLETIRDSYQFVDAATLQQVLCNASIQFYNGHEAKDPGNDNGPGRLRQQDAGIWVRRSDQSEEQSKARDCEVEHQNMTPAVVGGHSVATPPAAGAPLGPAQVVKHKLQQPSWRPSVMSMGRRCASAEDVSVAYPTLKRQGVEGLPHSSWRPSLLQTPAAAAMSSAAKPHRGHVAGATIGVHAAH